MRHEHYWRYDQTIYGYSSERHGVHRWCKCGVHQIADVGKWKKPTKAWDLDMLRRIAGEFEKRYP